jgi:hypothetical protein
MELASLVVVEDAREATGSCCSLISESNSRMVLEGSVAMDDSPVLVARHGWRASWPALMVAALLTAAIGCTLILAATAPDAAFVVALLASIAVGFVLVLECLVLLLGGAGLGTLFVLAARRSMALSVDARGITLGALPFQWARLGSRRHSVRTAGDDRSIPWSEVSVVHLPDTSRAWSGLWSQASSTLFETSGGPGAGFAWQLILRVDRRDGTVARRNMRGVRFDASSTADAVRLFAPEVIVTVE